MSFNDFDSLTIEIASGRWESKPVKDRIKDIEELKRRSVFLRYEADSIDELSLTLQKMVDLKNE